MPAAGRACMIGAALLAWAPGAAPATATAAGLLADAVRSADYPRVRALLGAQADPNRLLPDGSTVLAWAVEEQDPQMVKLLLEHGAEPDRHGAAAWPTLALACRNGDAAILDLLLSAHADAKAAADGTPVLALCARNAPAAILARMLDAGAEVEGGDAVGQTPLMWAAAGGRLDNIALLLRHGAAVNRRTKAGFTPLFFALKSGEPRASAAVLDAGGDPDYVAPDGTTTVQMAMYQHDHVFAARMIGRGADLGALDRNGLRLLHAAVLADQPQLVKLLLAKGADPNALTGTSRVKWRYEQNFKPGDYEVAPKSALLLAAEHGFTEVMTLLAGAGADSGYRDPDGNNIVLAAATSGEPRALELALHLQPDANTTTADGRTALHLLLSNGAGAEGAGPRSVAMMQILHDHGARIDLKDRAGQTAADIGEDEQFSGKTAFETIFRARTVSSL